MTGHHKKFKQLAHRAQRRAVRVAISQGVEDLETVEVQAGSRYWNAAAMLREAEHDPVRRQAAQPSTLGTHIGGAE